MQARTAVPHWFGPHSTIYTTLSRALDLSNRMSLLDPLFAATRVTVVSYFLLPHPKGWGDPRNRNPKRLSADTEALKVQFYEQDNRFE